MTVPPLTPAGLRCAHQVDPLGVAPDRIRLSWRLEGTGTGRAQRAYQILVKEEEPGTSAAWDARTSGSNRRPVGAARFRLECVT